MVLKLKTSMKEVYIDMKKIFVDVSVIVKSITLKINSKGTIKDQDHLDMLGVYFFTRLYATSKSILKLLPENLDEIDDYYDYNSIFSLTRNIIECSEMLYYVCFDDKNRDIQLLRFAYFKLYERNYMAEHFRQIRDKDNQEKCEKEIDSLIKKIERYPQFQNLNQEQRKRFKKIKGRFFDHSRNSIEKKMNYLHENSYKLAYSLFSASAHSFPTALYPMAYRSFNSKEGIDWEIEYITSALFIGSKYLAHSAKNLIDKLIKKHDFIYDRYSKEEKTDLEEIYNKLVVEFTG